MSYRTGGSRRLRASSWVPLLLNRTLIALWSDRFPPYRSRELGDRKQKESNELPQFSYREASAILSSQYGSNKVQGEGAKVCSVSHSSVCVKFCLLQSDILQWNLNVMEFCSAFESKYLHIPLEIRLQDVYQRLIIYYGNGLHSSPTRCIKSSKNLEVYIMFPRLLWENEISQLH